MTLTQKIKYVAQYLNHGTISHYGQQMLEAIKAAENGNLNYKVYEESIAITDRYGTVYLHLQYLIGEALLNHNRIFDEIPVE